MSKHEKLKAEIERFVNGYVAGSCNSYDHCLSLITEEIQKEDPSICSQLVEQTFDAVLGETEIFLCDTCAWWCWSHEMSEGNDSVCADCSPDGDKNYE